MQFTGWNCSPRPVCTFALPRCSFSCLITLLICKQRGDIPVQKVGVELAFNCFIFHLHCFHIRLVHRLQTLASLKSWLLLRTVFQLWNKRQSLSEELPEEREPAMKFSAAALHPVISSRICWLLRSSCEDLPVRGVPHPSMFSLQLVRVSSKPGKA